MFASHGQQFRNLNGTVLDMSETPETLARGRGEQGLIVGNRIVSGVAPAGANTVLQSDSSGNLTADQSIDLSEITDPGPSSAGTVVLFAEDVSGSTRLVARFPSGARQQIVIEQ